MSRWEPGNVTDVLPHRSRSIKVNPEKGSRVRRNRVDICESSVSRRPEATASSQVMTREETERLPVHEPEVRTTQDSSYTTRSGRVVKQLLKLDL